MLHSHWFSVAWAGVALSYLDFGMVSKPVESSSESEHNNLLLSCQLGLFASSGMIAGVSFLFPLLLNGMIVVLIITEGL